MAKPKLTLLKGGLDITSDLCCRYFISGFITDTRLMGVMGMYTHYQVDNGKSLDDYHLFFYFDAEEYGFENYLFVHGNDESEIHHIDNVLMGGLGGKRVDLTEEECKYILQDFVALNRKLHLPMPEGIDGYRFLLNSPSNLTDEEKEQVFQKTCTPLFSDYHAVNYFLMRVFGHDYRPAEFLCEGDVNVHIYESISPATLAKNNIEEYMNEDGISYLTESLIECNNSYMLVVSELTLDENHKITSFEKRSAFKVSASEAAMMLCRSEFLTVYTTLFDPVTFEEFGGDLIKNSIVSNHENGRLYMIFNKDNDHVDAQTYRLNNDINGMYYISDYGQLIAVSYRLEGIHQLEKNILSSSFSNRIIPAAKYEFKEPILYDFIQSGFETFSEFLEFIQKV